jgi:hypothetical protein
MTTIETTIGAIVVIETDAMIATANERDRYGANQSRNQYNN